MVIRVLWYYLRFFIVDAGGHKLRLNCTATAVGNVIYRKTEVVDAKLFELGLIIFREVDYFEHY